MTKYIVIKFEHSYRSQKIIYRCVRNEGWWQYDLRRLNEKPIWKGDDYKEGLRIAKEANARRRNEKIIRKSDVRLI